MVGLEDGNQLFIHDNPKNGQKKFYQENFLLLIPPPTLSMEKMEY